VFPQRTAEQAKPTTRANRNASAPQPATPLQAQSAAPAESAAHPRGADVHPASAVAQPRASEQPAQVAQEPAGNPYGAVSQLGAEPPGNPYASVSQPQPAPSASLVVSPTSPQSPTAGGADKPAPAPAEARQPLFDPENPPFANMGAVDWPVPSSRAAIDAAINLATYYAGQGNANASGAAQAQPAVVAAPAAALAQGWDRNMDTSRCRIGKSIKDGNFGEVRWLNNTPDGQKAVIKTAKDATTLRQLQNEAAIHARLPAHKNIVGCAGMRTIGGEQGLVMEGIEGEDMKTAIGRLDKLYRGDKEEMRRRGLNRHLGQEEYFGTLQYLTREMMQGAQHLAENGIVHADIRPANIMIDDNTGNVKIVDFGSAFRDGPQPEGTQLPFRTGSVAPDYTRDGGWAPVTGKADVFSIGEAVRSTVERQEFRYLTKKTRDQLSFQDIIDYDDSGEEALQAKPNTPAKDAASASAAVPNAAAVPAPAASLADLKARISALLEDSFIRDSVPAQELRKAITTTEAELTRFANSQPPTAGSASAASTLEDKLRQADQSRVQAILAPLTERVRLAEERLRKSGTYGATSSYTDFVTAAMSADARDRPTAESFLRNFDFLNPGYALLDDDKAREVLKLVVANGVVIRLDPASVSDVSEEIIEDDPAPAVGQADQSASRAASALAPVGQNGNLVSDVVEEVIEDDPPPAASLAAQSASSAASASAGQNGNLVSDVIEEVIEDDPPAATLVGQSASSAASAPAPEARTG